MGDIKEKEIKFGSIVDHLKDDPAAGEKIGFKKVEPSGWFWNKQKNLWGRHKIETPHKVTT